MHLDLHVIETERTCCFFTANSHKFSLFRQRIQIARMESSGEDQKLVVFPPLTAAETVQIPEADTWPVKTMTVLQCARPRTNTNKTTTRSMKRVPQGVVTPEGPVGSSGDTDINVWSEHKLRSLSKDKLHTLVEVSGDSTAKTLKGPFCLGRSPCMRCSLETRKKKGKST